MSDYYIKIIPADPYCQVDMRLAKQVQSYLEKIACPFCGSDLWDWWAGEMDRAAGEDGLFARLDEKKLPCCGRTASLNDLKYDYPCGFACTEFIMLYPREQLTQRHIKTVERILGMRVKVIHSRI